jgi:hypothetical protein
LTQEVEKLKFQIDELTPVILFQWTCWWNSLFFPCCRVFCSLNLSTCLTQFSVCLLLDSRLRSNSRLSGLWSATTSFQK